MDPATVGLHSLHQFQDALQVITALQLAAYHFPQPETVTGGASYDYVIVGGGTAGSVVAERLSENPNCSVAIIEAGGGPPLESVLPGLFPLTAQMPFDFNYPTEPNMRYGQYLQDKIVRLTAGKLLGGSSSLNHMIYVRGVPEDYQRWAKAANDETWNYENLLPYFKKSERLVDPEILNSTSGKLYGTGNGIGLARQPSKSNDVIIKSFQELGYEYRLDVTAEHPLGIVEPLLTIAEDLRQSTAQSILSKHRKNLQLFEHTTVTKILFDENKNAVGVEALTSDNETVTIKANKEVLIAAGALKTPQLLMLSGVGPKSDLDKFNISVMSNLPVGQALTDHVGTAVFYKMQSSHASVPPSNPHKFPAPTTVAFKALEPSSKNPNCEYINLIFPHNSAGLLQVCLNVLKYNKKVCDQIFKGNQGRDILLSVVFTLQPSSTGTVRLRSLDPLDYPLINMGYFSNSSDLDTLASCLKDLQPILNTTYFKEMGAEFLDIDLEECESMDSKYLDYWKCYGGSLSTTMWHPAASAPLGSVLDARLRVLGVQKLRVVDAAAIPNLNSGKLESAVLALAEKAADLIKEDSLAAESA